MLRRIGASENNLLENRAGYSLVVPRLQCTAEKYFPGAICKTVQIDGLSPGAGEKRRGRGGQGSGGNVVKSFLVVHRGHR